MTTAEEKLVNTIMQWLSDGPTSEEVLYYVRHLPVDKQYLVRIAAGFFEQRLYDEKHDYFTAAKLDYFIKNIAEANQLTFLEWFTQYSIDSVRKNILKRYPDFPSQLLPKDISSWSSSYVARWRSLAYFTVTADFDTLSLYAKSFIRSNQTAAGLEQLNKALRQAYLAIGQRVEGLRFPSEPEINEERELLTKLQFLPSEYIEEVLDDFSEQKISKLLFQLIHIINLILALDILKIRKNPDQFFISLLEELRVETEESMLVDLEALRVVTFENSADLEKVSATLFKYWNFEALQNAEWGQQFSREYLLFTPSQQQTYQNYIEPFLEQSSMLEFLVSPLPVEFVIAKIRTIHDSGTLLSFIDEARQEVDPEVQPFFEKTIRSLNLLLNIDSSLKTQNV